MIVKRKQKKKSKQKGYLIYACFSSNQMARGRLLAWEFKDDRTLKSLYWPEDSRGSFWTAVEIS